MDTTAWELRMMGPTDNWVRNSRGHGIAELSPNGPNPEADRCLIAAAPVLRHALERLVSLVLSKTSNGAATPECRSAIEALRMSEVSV